MAGDCNDQHGWFPQAYVEMITMAAPAAVQTPPSATSPPSTDPVAENKEDVKVHVENAASKYADLVEKTSLENLRKT